MMIFFLLLASLNILALGSNTGIYFPNRTLICDSGEKCISFAECETAVSAYKSRKTMPKTCCFKGKTQYVCCAVGGRSKSRTEKIQVESSTKITQTSKEKISEKMCLEHHRFTDTVIVGGLDAVDWEFIYMAVLRWGEYKGPSSYNCGGVLISPNFVLTAAHCTLWDGQQPSHVRIGGEKLTLPPVNDVKIKRIIVHSDYNPETNINDLALLELEDKKIFAVGCLWYSSEPPTNMVTAIGYGQKGFARSTSNTLQKVNLTLYSNQNCEKEITLKLNKKQICAGDWLGERDTCAGDSGGPILVNMEKEEREVPYIIGITSFGGYCASGLPAVYTRVSEYREWIESIVWGDVMT